MGVAGVLGQLEGLRGRGGITAWVRTEAQAGRYSEFPEGLHPQLVRALGSRGVRRLYSHQLEAWERVRAGEHVVVVTPTASGKTLCYNLPVLQHLIEYPEARALYLFPTKALAQDQMTELQELIAAVGEPLGVHTYDGDTPGDMRRRIRRQGRVILSNPDMLHAAFLPHHPKWIELFQNLKFVVVDELHTYRGVFGSHVANVFRRLKRVARFYNSEIQFICASATIANPQELAEKLLEAPVHPIENSGAPRAARTLIFYNPPVVNQELGLRRSALSAARRFAERFLKQGVQTLVFATSRVNVEVLLTYLKRVLPARPGEREKIRGYRGGYLPRTRREIERQLREKEILGVVSTNALELGIDIGTLECCILAGYPGSIASTWQQIGRAGRRTGESAAIFIARNLPLDQFIVNHPEYFMDRSPEHGLIDADNLSIFVSHVKCAAFELPFRGNEGNEPSGSFPSFPNELGEILLFLEERGVLHHSGDAWHWSEEAYPADSVSLRSVAEENFVVFNLDDQSRAVAEVDFDSAPELIHQDAIYLCEGRQYHVERLDYDGRKAYVREVKVDYYTDAISYSGLRILRSEESRAAPPALVEHGEVHLMKKVPGFKKVRFYTSENLGFGNIELPLHELHTTSYWMTVPEEALAELGLTRKEIILGFLGIAYALHHIATLVLMCDLRDLGRSVGDRSGRWFVQAGAEGLGFYSPTAELQSMSPERLETFDPTLFLYDNHPGGVGFSEKLYARHSQILEQARGLIDACGCRAGCPSCVGPVDEVGEATKRVSLGLLGIL